MLFNLATPLAQQFILFNLFRYLTFRSGAACLTAMVVSFWLGPKVIRWLNPCRRQVSRSAPTARNVTSSKRRARPPWAAC